MRWGRAAAFALGLTLATSASACIVYERYGPVFTPSPQPAPGYAVVYIYRPTKAWGAAQLMADLREAVQRLQRWLPGR